MSAGGTDGASIARGRRWTPIAIGAAVVFVVLFIVAIVSGMPFADPKPTPGLPASPVEGVVVAVDSAGLGQVRGFRLRPTGSPFAFSVTLGALENATEFSPSHLAEHMASSEPIRAWYRLEAGVPVVYRLEDAPG